MRRMAVIFAALLFGIVGAVKGQGWRGIVPLHSTCEDVKRILNITKCETTTVALEDVTVFINFSDGTCGSEWKVARGTVVALDVRPKETLRLADLQLDLTEYSREIDNQMPNTVYFKNRQEGLTVISFEDGRIRHLFYGPSSKDEHLRCSPQEVSGPGSGGHGSVKIDEYGFISFRAEVPLLDEFATTLNGWVGARGYIIVYPGRTTTFKQAQARAVRAKKYLVNKKRVDRNRIVTVIGGYREESSVELFITVKNGDPPSPSPTRDPTKVPRE